MSADRLQDRTVAITGGARGIGRAIATAATGRGMNVVIGDVDFEAAQATAAELGSKVRAHQLDVTDEESFAAFLDAVEREFGRTDVLVNNAGIMPAGAFMDETRESTQRQVEINIFGVVNGCRLALPRFVGRGGGHIINLSSVAGKGGYAGIATYSGTKFYVYGFSEALRAELQGTGVDVTVVMPGFVQTELTAGIGEARFFKRISPEDVAAGVIGAIATPRFDVFVPKNLGPMGVMMSMLPRGWRDAALRFSRADRLALEFDPVKREAYEQRAARSTPAAAEAEATKTHATSDAGS
jgi:NAD(P)-dependent dehydrogenase (short-subunit alcohol dehydrogenase family)